MSAINYKLYQNDTANLVRSIVLKNSHFAKLDNDLVTLKGGQVSEDKRQWKYYLNLSGQYHSTDTPMTIKSLDTMEIISFDKNTLMYHRATVKEYFNGSDYYKMLVQRYPDQEALISGILNPIDIDSAINAQDFKILYFNKLLVEKQETNLIPELQKRIDSIVARFYIEVFSASDELYVHAFNTILGSFLGEMIENIRLDNCGTYKAHSYHIWEYLESNGYLSRYKDVLSLEQALWLYRNIRAVKQSVGREDTFNKLMEVLLTKRGIPLGRYTMVHGTEGEDTTTLSTAAESIDSTMVKRVPIMMREPLNLFRSLSRPVEIRDIDILAEKQIPLAINNIDALEYSLPKAKLDYSRTLQNELPTKLYESEMTDLTDSRAFKLGDVLINHWLAMAVSGRYRASIAVANPQTGDVMTMSMKEAFITWLYAFNAGYGNKFDIIPTVRGMMTVRSTLPTFQQFRNMTNKRWLPDADLNKMMQELPLIGSPISTESFFVMCDEIHRNALARRQQYVSVGNKELKRSMQSMFWATYETKDYQLGSVPNESYLAYFSNRGWDVAQLSKYDSAALALDIFRKATGTDTQSVLTLKDIQRSMLQIMKQLGTYSVQYIQTINSSPLIPAGPVQMKIGDVRTSTEVTAVGQLITPQTGDVSSKLNFSVNLDISLQMRVSEKERSGTVKLPVTPIINTSGAMVQTVKCRMATIRARVL